MNKTFKIVFNKARGALMVANEVTSSVQKKGVKPLIATVAAMACGAATAASDDVLTDGTFSLTENTTITLSSKNTSGETNRYSGIAATSGNTSVTVADGATLTINGSLEDISGAQRLYLISAQSGSTLTTSGSIVGSLSSTSGGSLRGVRTVSGDITINGPLTASINGGNEAIGAEAWNGAHTVFNGAKTAITLNTTGPIYAIQGQAGSVLDFNSAETTIRGDNSSGSSTYAQGIYTYQATLNFAGNTTISVKGNTTKAFGINAECDTTDTNKTIVNFSGNTTTLDVSTSSGDAYGMRPSGPAEVNFKGKTASVTADSKAGNALAVQVQYGGHANFQSDASITATTQGDGSAYGVSVSNYAEYAGNASFSQSLNVTAKADAANAYGLYNDANSTKASKSTSDGVLSAAGATTVDVSAANTATGIYSAGDLAQTSVGRATINASSAGAAYGVTAKSESKVNLGAAGQTSTITATASSGKAVGIDVSGGATVTLNGNTAINAATALQGDGTLVINGDLTTTGTVSGFTGTAKINSGTITLTSSTGYFGGTVEMTGGSLTASGFKLASGQKLSVTGGTLTSNVGMLFQNSDDSADATLASTSVTTKDGVSFGSSATLILTDSGTYKMGLFNSMLSTSGVGTLSLANATVEIEKTEEPTEITANTTVSSLNAAEASVKVTDKTLTIQGDTASTVKELELSGSDSKLAVAEGTEVTVETLTSAGTVAVAEGGTVNATTLKSTGEVTVTGGTAAIGTLESTDSNSKVAISDSSTVSVTKLVSSGEVAIAGKSAVKVAALESDGGKINITGDSTLEVETASGHADIAIGSADAADGQGATMSIKKLAMTGGSLFVDPVYGHAVLSIAEVENNALKVDVIAGTGSLVTVGATEAEATANIEKLGLSESSAVFYTTQSLDITSGSISVAKGLTADDPAGPGCVYVGQDGALVVSQSAGKAFTNADNTTSLTFEGGKLGIINATGGNLTLADTVVGTPEEIVTDNPFIVATLSGNTVTSSMTAEGGLGAIGSTGIQAMTRRADTVLAQTIADRTSVDQDYATGASLWVDVTGERYEADKLDNHGSFKSDMGYGAFGADFAITSDVAAGAAIQYGKGTLRSSVSSIKNKINSYGVTAYGSLKFGEAKVVAEAAYVKNKNDISSSQAALNQKVDADIYSLGIRGQHRFTAGSFQFVPSVGVRVSRLNTDSMKVGSVKVKKQEQTLVQVPIALRVNGFEQNTAGWSVVPSFKVAYVPTFGDKEITVLGSDQTVIDTSPVQGDFGVRAQKGNLMLNANFMVGGGKDGTSSVGGKVGLKYVF